METELLKLIGGGSAQLILVAGYIPLFWLVRTLWIERGEMSSKLLTMLQAQFTDQAVKKDLWDTQGKLVESQTRAIADLTRQVQILSDMQRSRS